MFILNLTKNLFNHILEDRVKNGTWNSLLPGDCANLDGNNSFFAVNEVNVELQRRCDALDIHPSGPLWGTGTLQSAGDVAARVGATWVRSDDATRAADSVPTPILQRAFELAAPDERSRSVGETQLEDGKRAIVLVTNANLGDFGATTEFERLQLADQLTDFFGQRDFEGLIQTLRSDASIETGMTVTAN